MRHQAYPREPLSTGDLLALDRTHLANERTFLAYLRAAIMLGVSSISILKLLPDEPALVVLAWVMLPASLLLALIGTIRSARLAKSLRQLEQSSSSSTNIQS